MNISHSRRPLVDPGLAWSPGPSVQVAGTRTIAQVGVVLARSMADRVGLSAGLSLVLERAKFPQQPTGRGCRLYSSARRPGARPPEISSRSSARRAPAESVGLPERGMDFVDHPVNHECRTGVSAIGRFLYLSWPGLHTPRSRKHSVGW